jgi:hypothetical protein
MRELKYLLAFGYSNRRLLCHMMARLPRAAMSAGPHLPFELQLDIN